MTSRDSPQILKKESLLAGYNTRAFPLTPVVQQSITPLTALLLACVHPPPPVVFFSAKGADVHRLLQYYCHGYFHLILLLFCVPVTTGRKAVTMVLSFIFFAKPFTIQ